MEHRILVAVDDSPWARRALDVGVALVGGRPEARLEALHVVNVAPLSGRLLRDLAGLMGFEPVLVPEAVERVYLARGEELLEELFARAAESGVALETHLEQGAISERLMHHAATCGLLIVGARGEGESSQPGSGGSTLERLVRRSPVSTLVVPSSPLALKGITVGLDGSEGAGRALVAARWLAGLLGLPVQLVTVGEVSADLHRAVALLTGDGLSVTASRVEGEAHEALVAACLDAGHDLLALGFRRRPAQGTRSLGRVVEPLIGHVDLGLLIAR